MIKSVIVNVQESFAGMPVFLACEPKQERVDRKDSKSPMQIVPGKWTVQLMVKPLSEAGEKVQRENINVTIESKSNPCEGLEEFDKVVLDHLEYNVMTTERGQAMVFWRVRGIRSAVAAASTGGQPAAR